MIEEPVTAPAPRPTATAWKVATAAVALVGLILAGTVYLLMSGQVAEQRERIDELEEGLASAENDDGDGGSGLGALLGDLLDDDAFGDIDERLMRCLAPDDGIGLNFGEGSIPDADLETQVEAIIEIVAEERALPATSELDIEFVSVAEVQRRAVAINGQHLDRERAEVDVRTLSLLGAIEPGLDLVQAQLDALDAGVAGFYDPDTRELVIGSESMDAMGAFITAHEFVHALTDAALGLPDLGGLADNQGSDAAYAALSAIEGDASLYSQRFVSNHLPFDQLLDLEADSAEAMDELGLPHFVVRNLEFPYLEGMTFTCDVFLDGGWEAVNDTYRTPPATSAQVLFPDRYREDEAAGDVRSPAGPAGWELLRTDTFGAADLLFLLEAPGDDESAALSDPIDRVAAWAGGEVNTWADGDAGAVAVVLADRGGTAMPLCDTVAEFYAAAFPDATESADGAFEGPNQAAVVECSNAEVALGIGPDLETAAAAIG